MRINHNVTALNTYNQLTKNNTATSSAIEKLSSGLRINSAADDAAGLAISEKMRAQIRGLDQAERNSQDGISMVQTAEGALSETQSILQRMRELAVQSSNDTNTNTDRDEIQKEINQLTSEINRIGNTTEFNTQSLLDGTKAETIVGTETNSVTAMTGGTSGTYASGLVTLSSGISEGETITVNGQTIGFYDSTAGTYADDTAAASGMGVDEVIDLNTYSGMSEIASGVEVAIDGFSGVDGTIDGTNVRVIATASGVGGNSIDISTSGAVTDGSLTMQIGANSQQSFTASINDMRAVSLGIAGTTAGSSAQLASGSTVNGVDITSDEVTDTEDAIFTSGTGNALTDVSADGTTEYALDVSSADAATAAIEVIDKAIESVSSERSRLGAYQNRLEHTANNLSTSSENLTAAESRIRDVDMAKEMMNYTKNNILSQAAQSMLAQANQQPQGVLQLLG